jgi:hypothetical protein
VSEEQKVLVDSVVKPWVHELTYKMQTVLFLALRGCDSAAKNEPGKDVTRALRSVVLRNAMNTSGFMRKDVPPLNMDECEGMPVHWMMHLIHATEVVAYMHPLAEIRGAWLKWYMDAIHKLHVGPEPVGEFLRRMAGDNGPVVTDTP